MSKRKVVQFDIDGVLADFLTGYRAVQSKLGLEPTYTPAWDDYWNDDVWRVIKDPKNLFWRHLPMLASPHEFARINDFNYAFDVYFVTARPGATAKVQTQQWLQLKGISSPTVIVSSEKGGVANAIEADFVIEDNAGNAWSIATRSDAKTFLLDAPYNQQDVSWKVTRIKTVNEFLDEVSR